MMVRAEKGLKDEGYKKVNMKFTPFSYRGKWAGLLREKWAGKNIPGKKCTRGKKYPGKNDV